MNVCEFTLYEYSWKRGERIPRDITCIYSRVFYRQVSVHVSVHAAKKRRKKKKRRANRRGKSIGHRFSARNGSSREERGVVSISRLAKARGTRDGARSTPFAYRTKSSFIKILRLHFTEAERKNAGVARLPPSPSSSPLPYMEI